MTETCKDSVEFKIAKWKEDQTWYRAVILSAAGDSQNKVNFIDYGNVDYVDCIVENIKAIPPGDQIDQFVLVNSDGKGEASDGKVRRTFMSL